MILEPNQLVLTSGTQSLLDIGLPAEELDHPQDPKGYKQKY